MSYGNADEIAALTPVHANEYGVFDSGTRPTLATVTTLIAQISAILDAALAAEHLTTPVTGDIATALRFFVNQEVAAIVEGVNGAGRFGPTADDKQPSRSRFQIIMSDVREFIATYARGVSSTNRPEDAVITML